MLTKQQQQHIKQILLSKNTYVAKVVGLYLTAELEWHERAIAQFIETTISNQTKYSHVHRFLQLI